MAETPVPDDNYWPDPIKTIPLEKPWEEKHVVVAQISRPWGNKSYRHMYTALVPPRIKKDILNNPGGIGHDVSITGPHPSPFRGKFDYVPKFWIWAAEIVSQGLEPLVVAWRTGDKIVLLPDQGFLMTYGLVPRIVGESISWDDIQRPYYDVVITKMASEYSFDANYDAFVKVDRKYLEDYATVRNRALVQVYYALNVGEMSAEDRKILSISNSQEFKLKGRLLDIHVDSWSKDQIVVQVWGVRHLVDPKDSPVIEGRWDYGELIWPGIEEVITDDHAQQLGLKDVFVDDSVLEQYEEHPDRYSIHPETGAVSYRNQWSVGYCRRVSRNLIRLEIRKLYEGCPPDVVKHWHKYAVYPPGGNIRQSADEPNVGSRSKKIVYSLVTLGEILSKISNKITGRNLASEDFVKLGRGKLNYYGWWNEQNIIPVTRHIPLSMGEDKFLERCKGLNSLVVEGFNEGNLRKLLIDLGINSESLGSLRGLKLLDTLIQHSLVKIRTGLIFIKDAKEIEGRRAEMLAASDPKKHFETPIDILFVLYDLRIAGAHRDMKIGVLLGRLGTDRASVTTGFGKALDTLYDSVADALQQTNRILSDAFSGYGGRP